MIALLMSEGFLCRRLLLVGMLFCAAEATPGWAGCHPTNVPANTRTVCVNGRGTRQVEPALAVSGSVVVTAFNDYRGSFCAGEGYQLSGWACSLNGGAAFQEGHTLPGGGLWGADSWLATGPDGAIYHSALTITTNSKLNIILSRGDVATNGVAWASPILYQPPTGSVDKPAMAVDATGTVYVAYSLFAGPSNPQSGLWVLRSSDRAQSFEGPFQVCFTSPTNGSHGVFATIGLNNELYLAWKVGTSSVPTNTIYFARSLDRGQTYGSPVVVAVDCPFSVPGTEANAAFPQLAIDRSDGTNRGTLYLAWQTACPPAGTNSAGDIVFSRSTNGGTNWSAPIVVNSDAGLGTHVQPALTVDRTGKVWLFFYRAQAIGGNLALADLLLTQSTDGDQHFTPVQTVTDTASTWGYIAEPGSTNYGDYITAVSTSNHVFVAWTDARFGDPDIFVLRMPVVPEAPALTAAGFSGTNFTFSFTGSPGFIYTIQGATALSPANWTPLSPAFCSGTNFNYTDSGAANYSNRFYRAVFP